MPARWWLGLTATPERVDGLDDLIGFQLGPVRHQLEQARPGTLEAAAGSRPALQLIVHTTPFRYDGPDDMSQPGAMPALSGALAGDETRNQQILDDILAALGRGRHCLVLADRVSHVEYFAGRLSDHGFDPVVLKGGMGARQTAEAMNRLQPNGTGSPLLAVGTGAFVGEGFDCPVLDTLFLAVPAGNKGKAEQYAGRVVRSHPGKTTVEVHDYHDVGTPVLAARLRKRAPGYLRLGFTVPGSL